MSLRDDQRAMTRQRILDAVLDLVATGTMGELSIPLVAKRSGVSVPTIYRYFPTKDALLDAAAMEPARQGAGEPVSPAVTDGPAFLRKAWSSFADTLPLIRRQATSETGAAMRSRRHLASREWFRERIRADGIDPDSPEGERLVHLALLLTSSLAFLDLHDRQGLPPEQSADEVTWAVAVLTEATRRLP